MGGGDKEGRELPLYSGQPSVSNLSPLTGWRQVYQDLSLGLVTIPGQNSRKHVSATEYLSRPRRG